MILGVENSVHKQYTIDDFITLGKNSTSISYKRFSILSKSIVSPEILYAENNIIYDYIEEFKKLAEKVELSDSNYHKYAYKPKLLAYDLYESTEIYFIILALNGMYDIKDFNKHTLNLLYRDDMLQLLSLIYNAESGYISANRKKVGDKDIYS